MAIVGRMEDMLVIGLEEKNIEKLKDDQPFTQDLRTVGFPFRILIFYGETMEDLRDIIQDKIGPDTDVLDRTRKQ